MASPRSLNASNTSIGSRVFPAKYRAISLACSLFEEGQRDWRIRSQYVASSAWAGRITMSLPPSGLLPILGLRGESTIPDGQHCRGFSGHVTDPCWREFAAFRSGPTARKASSFRPYRSAIGAHRASPEDDVQAQAPRLRFWPQPGQSPEQSSRQTSLIGRANRTCSFMASSNSTPSP